VTKINFFFKSTHKVMMISKPFYAHNLRPLYDKLVQFVKYSIVACMAIDGTASLDSDVSYSQKNLTKLTKSDIINISIMKILHGCMHGNKR
jgi:hypothetical protein